jgi:hypothetical protein
MNVFYEFHKVAQALQKTEMPYALVGGVAMAFYSTPRFTKDIDILVKKDDLQSICNILKKIGYLKSASPWTFKNSGLTLYRFLKVKDGDEMLIDVLVAENTRIEKMVDKANIAESKGTGRIRVVNKNDLNLVEKSKKFQTRSGGY